MPAKYILRNFAEGEIYHVMNRGVNHMEIFPNEEDYKTFYYYLYIYIAPKHFVLKKYPNLPIRLQHKNLCNEIELLAYCLMPNHFHLLIKIHKKDALSKLMKQLTNAYAEYFNKRYKHSGPVVEGRYKAVHVETDEQLVHVSRYIHLNPLIAGLVTNIKHDRWTSYSDYISNHSSEICSTDLILSQFPTKRAYELFVLDHINYAKQLNVVKHLLLENP